MTPGRARAALTALVLAAAVLLAAPRAWAGEFLLGAPEPADLPRFANDYNVTSVTDFDGTPITTGDTITLSSPTQIQSVTYGSAVEGHPIEPWQPAGDPYRLSNGSWNVDIKIDRLRSVGNGSDGSVYELLFVTYADGKKRLVVLGVDAKSKPKLDMGLRPNGDLYFAIPDVVKGLINNWGPKSADAPAAPASQATTGQAAIIQGDAVKVGAGYRQALTPPGPDFTAASADSDNPGLQVQPPDHAAAGWGVNFTLKDGWSSPVGVTVTWKNPKTGEQQYQFVVVNPTDRKYDQVTAVTASTQPDHNLVTLPADNGHFLNGEGQYGHDAMRYPHMVWFVENGLYYYEYEYTDAAGGHHWGLFVINVARLTQTPAAAPAKNAPSAPAAAPAKPAPATPPHDDHGGGGD
ncbi:MAG: hypothetical protein ACYDAB_00625 [bacterium]